MTEIPKFYYVIPAIGIAIVLALLFMPTQADDVYFLNQGGGSSSGVTTLTSNNSAIALNASSGNILITPRYELLCENSIANGSQSDILSCSNFEIRSYLEIVVELRNTLGTVDIAVEFNNDNGTNYSWRRSNNGGADSTSVNRDNCLVWTTLANNAKSLLVMQFYNNRGDNIDRKTGFIDFASEGNSNAGFTPSRAEMVCKYANTTEQITTVSIKEVSGGAGTFTGFSKIFVWGYD